MHIYKTLLIAWFFFFWPPVETQCNSNWNSSTKFVHREFPAIHVAQIALDKKCLLNDKSWIALYCGGHLYPSASLWL